MSEGFSIGPMKGAVVVVRGLRSVSLFASDVQASRRFYRDLLGLPVLTDEEWGVVLQTGTVQLFLHPRGDQDQRGVELVFDVDDVDEVVTDLRSHGVTVVDEPGDREWGDRDASVADPDGNSVYLRTQLSRG
jgi:lactoylglutathione lyase